MKQVEMRVECSNRGLITYGDSNVLKTRLEKDEARGLFRGNLQTMSDEYLQEGCRYLSIPSKGDRETLVRAIRKYNAYKRQHVDGEEMKGGFNAGLPAPEDKLGVQNRPILGTVGSHIYSSSYTAYIQSYERRYGTTTGAVTLRFWRIHRYPDVPAEKLWPVKYYDARIDSSDDRENEP